MTRFHGANATHNELTYPALCLSKRAGISIVRSKGALGHSTASLVWRAAFYEELRVIDSAGTAYDVVASEIISPTSAVGQAIARLFDASVRVDPQLRSAGPATLEEVRARVTSWVIEDPEAVEEMSGRPAAWWSETLARCTDAAGVVRAVDAAAHTA
jgi:hypothetical protein